MEMEDTHTGLGLVENSRNKAKDSLPSKVLLLYQTQRNFFWKQKIVSEKTEQDSNFQQKKFKSFWSISQLTHQIQIIYVMDGNKHTTSAPMLLSVADIG